MSQSDLYRSKGIFLPNLVVLDMLCSYRVSKTSVISTKSLKHLLVVAEISILLPFPPSGGYLYPQAEISLVF